tara:strand:- start:1341 stop:2153 length:813 start_codon:yes stop_codon:yes gene_type:complete
VEITQILGYFGALAIGVVLGLIGSGGSLMAIPIFTYLFQIGPVMTTAYSLFVVGAAATVGALGNFKKRLVNFRIVIFFGIPAFISVFLVRKFLIPAIPEKLFSIHGYIVTQHIAILFLLAILMLASGYPMIRNNKVDHNHLEPLYYNYSFMIFAGVVIGILTGVIGVGGGFLIVPSLVLYLRLPMKKAVATSMFIIALKSLIGFLGDILSVDINWTFLFGFTLISVLGILLGSYLSTLVKGEKLKKYFGGFLIFIALGIFVKELFFIETK